MTTLEDVLASHELRYDEWAIADTWLCLCGWVPDMESVDFSEHATRTVDLAVDRLHAEHVAAVIREHWHIVEKVALPREDDDACFCTEVSAAPGKNVVRVYLDDPRHQPDEARELASQILSAADVAESQP